MTPEQIEHCNDLDDKRAHPREAKFYFMAKDQYFKLIGIGKTATILNLQSRKTSQISIEKAKKLIKCD